MPLDDHFNIYTLSEAAVTVEFGDSISGGTLQRINNFNNLLYQRPFPGFKTTVPAYTTLTVFFDPVQVIQAIDLRGAGCFEKVSDYLSALGGQSGQVTSLAVDTVTVPVCYGGAFGPDLAEVANLHSLKPQEVINLHTAPVYKVYMIGFVPGFAYLGGMPEKLATARKSTPRNSVPAGSVGIAGAQTGVYPLATPGGWQIIGRTPLRLFDAARQQPSLLKAGDQVIFKPVDEQEFDYLAYN